MRIKSFSIITGLTFFFAALVMHSGFGQSGYPKNKNLLTVKHTNDFIIKGDGKVSDWNAAEWIPLIQHSHADLKNAGWHIPDAEAGKQQLQYKTWFKVLYSDKGLYCLFKCEDSIITATLKGDFLNLFNEDVVEVFLRPDTSIAAYFEYELSPLNYELPILIINNKGDMMGWKPWKYEGSRKTKHAVKIDSKGALNNRFEWTAEFFIPFSLLHPLTNGVPKKGTRWHANFYRIDYDQGTNYSGWLLTRKGFHDPEKFGILVFE